MTKNEQISITEEIFLSITQDPIGSYIHKYNLLIWENQTLLFHIYTNT
jgi:hypothetical protein